MTNALQLNCKNLFSSCPVILEHVHNVADPSGLFHLGRYRAHARIGSSLKV